MHRLVQLSVQDWLAEGQENRRVVTTRVRVCGVELSHMQRPYGHELRGYFRIVSGYGLYSMYQYLHQKYACEVHVYEIHACTPVRHLHMRCTRMHACEVHAYETHGWDAH